MQIQEDSIRLSLDYSIVKEEYIVQDEDTSNVVKHLDEESFPCHLCQKTFKKENYLKYHLQRHKGERKYECGECGRKFTEKGILKLHLQRIHMGLKTHQLVDRYKKKFSCGQCGKITYDKYSYDKHITIHSDVRNVQCPKCPQKFRHKDNLREHMFVHVTERPFPCPMCGWACKRKKDLTQHIQRKRCHDQRKKPKAKKEKPLFPCSICGTTLKHKKSLRKHMIKHQKDFQESPIMIKTEIKVEETEIDFSNTLQDCNIIIKTEKE